MHANATAHSQRHTPHRAGRRLRWLLLGLTLILGACATPPPAPDPGASEASAAQAAMAAGNWLGAAENWENAARKNTAQASGYWVRAADAWWKAFQPELSEQALAMVVPRELSNADANLEALLRGEMALAAGDLQRAELYLTAATGSMTREQRNRLSTARAALEQQLRDPVAVQLTEVAATAAELPAGDALGAVSILRLLEDVPTQRLQAEVDAQSVTAPWAALTLAVRDTLMRRSDLLTDANHWADSQPDHPVDAAGYMEICWQYGQFFTPPGRIAVLLPTQGPLAAAGNAIRDGMLSGYFNDPAQTELVFFPLDETPEAAVAAYQQAVAAGFQWAIGPLRRESVTAIAQLDATPLPILLLNWPEPATLPDPAQVDEASVAGRAVEQNRQRQGLYSLSLSQEAEARSVARRMLADDQRQAIVLLADNSWGQRAEAAFIDEYLANEGRIVAIERFDPGEPDHSAKLTQLLQIEDSRERRRRLQSALGIRLEFEASRRDDFSALFMAADPALGRQLKPQLRFFDAGSKPVYAMGRVYSGTVNPRADSDLNQVLIPATSWASRDSETTKIPLSSLRNGAYGDLFALGQDTWGLLPWLAAMGDDESLTYPGRTGMLHVDQQGRIQRQPYWYRFERGAPALVDRSVGDRTVSLQ